MRVIRRLPLPMALPKTETRRPRGGQLGLSQPDAIGRLFIAHHFFSLGEEGFADLGHFVAAVEVEVELVEVGHIGGEKAVFVVGEACVLVRFFLYVCVCVCVCR